MRQAISFFFAFALVTSCGTRISEDKRNKIKLIEDYVNLIDRKDSLIERIVEGEFLDVKSHEKNGGFSNHYFYEETSNDLLKVKNQESIDDSWYERIYYFKDMKPVFVKFRKLKNNIEVRKGKFFLKNSTLIYSENFNKNELDFFQERVKDHLKQFQSSL